MQERHEHEQYFFDAATRIRFADLLQEQPRPCCLCAPMVGRELGSRGVAVTVLDIDERFAGLHDFRHFDIARPQWQADEFGLILCDPPFFNLSLRQLRDALRLLAHHRPGQPLLITWLQRRERALLDALAEFELRATDVPVGYESVADITKNATRLFTNLPEDLL